MKQKVGGVNLAAELEKVLNRLKNQYQSYEKELEIINDDTEGMIDISAACALANSIPYLIKQIEKQQQEIEGLEEQANAMAEKHAEKDIIMRNMQQELERYGKVLQEIANPNWQECKNYIMAFEKAQRIAAEAL